MLDFLRISVLEYFILQDIGGMGMMWRIFYTFVLKNDSYCITFQKWVAKLLGFAKINAWQRFCFIHRTNDFKNIVKLTDFQI